MENNNNSFLYIFLCLLEFLFLPSSIIRSIFTWIIGHSIQTNTKHKKNINIGISSPINYLFIFKYFNFFISDVLRIDLQIQFLLELFYQ